jgi:formate dehydrogenase major subunit
LEHGDWATIVSARAASEARVLLTGRIKPPKVASDPPRVIHQIGLPYHWGFKGLVRGDAANDLFHLALDPNVHIQEVKANDLFHLALDPNVHIQEVKAITCDFQPGRRPRTAASWRWWRTTGVGPAC